MDGSIVLRPGQRKLLWECPFDQPHLHADDLTRQHAAHLEVSHGSNVEWDGDGSSVA